MTLKKVELGKKGKEAVEQAIRLMLFTPKGAIPMRPDFGNPLLSKLDESVDLAQASQDIADALSQDSRIKVRRVVIDEKDLQNGLVNIKLDIEYLGDERDLVEVQESVGLNQNQVNLISLISPAQDFVSERSDVEFKFSAPTILEDFTLEIASDSSMQNIVQKSKATTKTRTILLPRRQNYWWRVRSSVELENRIVQVVSEIRQFKMTIDFALNAPGLIEVRQGESMAFELLLDLSGFDVDNAVVVELENKDELLAAGVSIEPSGSAHVASGAIEREVNAVFTANVQITQARFLATGLGMSRKDVCNISVIQKPLAADLISEFKQDIDMWFDANDLSQVSQTPVENWYQKSGASTSGAIKLLQTNVANRPLFIDSSDPINPIPGSRAVLFSNSSMSHTNRFMRLFDEVLSANNVRVYSEFTMFLVCRIAQNAPNNSILMRDNNSGITQNDKYISAISFNSFFLTRIGYDYVSTGFVQNTPNWANPALLRLSWLNAGQNLSPVSIRLNDLGGSLSNGGQPDNASIAQDMRLHVVGGNNNNTQPMFVFEFVVLKRQLANSDAAKFNHYFKKKYPILPIAI
jgi:phage baseplate assembly protein W